MSNPYVGQDSQNMGVADPKMGQVELVPKQAVLAKPAGKIGDPIVGQEETMALVSNPILGQDEITDGGEKKEKDRGKIRNGGVNPIVGQEKMMDNVVNPNMGARVEGMTEGTQETTRRKDHPTQNWVHMPRPG